MTSKYIQNEIVLMIFYLKNRFIDFVLLKLVSFEYLIYQSTVTHIENVKYRFLPVLDTIVLCLVLKVYESNVNFLIVYIFCYVAIYNARTGIQLKYNCF